MPYFPVGQKIGKNALLSAVALLSINYCCRNKQDQITSWKLRFGGWQGCRIEEPSSKKMKKLLAVDASVTESLTDAPVTGKTLNTLTKPPKRTRRRVKRRKWL